MEVQSELHCLGFLKTVVFFFYFCICILYIHMCVYLNYILFKNAYTFSEYI